MFGCSPILTVSPSMTISGQAVHDGDRGRLASPCGFTPFRLDLRTDSGIALNVTGPRAEDATNGPKQLRQLDGFLLQ